ncbi:hypothetical protein AKJ16_DCAP09338 [Drosera capensis]
MIRYSGDAALGRSQPRRTRTRQSSQGTPADAAPLPSSPSQQSASTLSPPRKIRPPTVAAVASALQPLSCSHSDVASGTSDLPFDEHCSSPAKSKVKGFGKQQKRGEERKMAAILLRKKFFALTSSSKGDLLVVMMRGFFFRLQPNHIVATSSYMGKPDNVPAVETTIILDNNGEIIWDDLDVLFSDNQVVFSSHG